MNPKLATIPDDALWLTGRSGPRRAARAARLEAWVKEAGIRPTFAEIEAERERRRITRGRTS